MTSDLLASAKAFQKKHKWEKAVECYSQYMTERNEQMEDTIYVSYARCLRYAGYGNHAGKVLTKGKKLYPASNPILEEMFILYDFLFEWSSAKAVANELIELNPEQGEHYFRLGKAYAYLKEYNHAREVYLSGLKLKHEMSSEQLMEKIKRGFTDKPDDYSSKYVYINGKNNYGAFIHSDGENNYFTKISKSAKGPRREVEFYKNVRGRFQDLQKIVPAFIDSQVIDGVLYFTSEMIEDTEYYTKQIHKVIRASMNISNVRYQEITELYSPRSYLFQMRNRPLSIVHFFTQIHEKYYNEKLFSGLYKLVEQNKYPSVINQVLQQLESHIMNNRLYAFILPEKHYSLLHGDFNTTNVKVRNDGVIQVFDWSSFTIGPAFIDTARYLTASRFPFATIKEVYLENAEMGGQLSTIEKIFFLYALILFYLLTFKEKGVEDRMEDCILPALEDVDEYVVYFMENEYMSSLITYSKEKEGKIDELEKKVFEINNENQTLKKQIQDLKGKNNTLNKQVKGLKAENKAMLNSKSWKITAPLRKFMERRKK